jgi:hypothetical protein
MYITVRQVVITTYRAVKDDQLDLLCITIYEAVFLSSCCHLFDEREFVNFMKLYLYEPKCFRLLVIMKLLQICHCQYH